MHIVKIGDCYINIANITHADFETTAHGLMCTVYFNCQVTDRNGCNGIQACKTFTTTAARDLKSWMDLHINSMEQAS